MSPGARFTAYVGCPYAPRCPYTTTCRASGTCYLNDPCPKGGAHLRVEDVTLDGEVRRVWCARCEQDLPYDPEEDPDGGSR